jgi:hypothetical protein
MKLFAVLVGVSCVAILIGATSAGAARPLKAPTITLTSSSIAADEAIPGTFDVTATVTWDRASNVSLWEPCSAVGLEKPECVFVFQRMLTSYTFHIYAVSSGDTVGFSVYACYVSGGSSYDCISSNPVSVTVP